MIPELGQLALCAAFLLALLQAAVPLAHWLNRPHALLGMVKPLTTLIFMLVSTAFVVLVYSYAVSDFSVLNVFANSHTDKPLLFKITGSWGNHEGSMLLWAWVLSGYGFLLAFRRSEDPGLRNITLAVLGAVMAGFLAFLIFTSNPFLRLWPAPLQGEDLNPLLQDIGLALHPPTLYVGYVGFAIVFCFAVAGLVRGRIDSAWARQVHPFILLPWSALTLGIGAGSWWAYRELGWGGWWFWDPVENVSLLPWLTGTALLHANIVLEKRGQLARWVVLLAILTFSMSLMGTFIVRSGLITSVHAFASDPARGMFILGYVGLTTGLALALYAWRPLAPSAPVALASRSGLILMGNVLLTAAAFTVLLAILYPVFLELAGAPGVSVGPQYFNSTFLPMTAPLLVLAALAPLLAWDKFTTAHLRAAVLRLLPALLVAGIVALTFTTPKPALLLAGVGLAAWLLAGSWASALRTLRARARFADAVSLRQLASVLAHAAVAVFVLGITATGLFKQTYEAPLVLGQALQMGEYKLSLREVSRDAEHNYIARRATFRVEKHGQWVADLTPELREYPARATQTTEAALHSTPLRDLYVVIGDASPGTDEQAIGVRLYVTPGQQWIWAGFVLAALGGGLALAVSLNARRNA